MRHILPTILGLALAAGACSSDSSKNTDPVGPPPAPATGTISGRVTNATTGTGIEGATITTQPATTTTSTDAQGSFNIPNVAVGTYSITASRNGYTSASTSTTVTSGVTSTANVALQSNAPPFTYVQAGIIAGPSTGIASIALSPNGRLIAYGTYADNLVRLADPGTRQELRVLTGHTRPVTEVAFSADSRFLASSGTVNLPPQVDGSVRTWDASTGAQLATVATPGTAHLAFSPNGAMLAGASGGDPVSIRVWSVPALTPTRTISGVFRFTAFSPDGARLISAGRSDVATVIDSNTGSTVTTFSGHTGWVTGAAYSANGQQVATAGEDRMIRVRNAQTGETLRTLTGHSSYPDYLSFSPDGTVLASLGSGSNITRTGTGGIIIGISSADRVLRLWNLTTGAELARVPAGSDVLVGVAFSADWSVLVTASEGGTIRVFQRAG